MLNTDRVLTLSWFGHFDPMHMKHTLVLLTALVNQAQILDLYVVAQYPHLLSFHPYS